MNWDSSFPFSQDEVNMFANLQAKATKFPLPNSIQKRDSLPPTQTEPEMAQEAIPLYSHKAVNFHNITTRFQHAQAQFNHSQDVLRQVDLLLEAHRQLCLLSASKTPNSPSSASPSPSAAKSDLLARLAAVQEQIGAMEEERKAEAFVQAAVLPSLTASPTFFEALKCLHRRGSLSSQLLQKTQLLMKRCWSNTLVAMERVLETDLDSIEAYMDDRSYTELKEKMLRPLLRIISLDPACFSELLHDFILEYVHLRQNSIRFLVQERLLSCDSSSSPPEQIMHLIERARLLMQVEAREFNDLFTVQLKTNNSARNEILELVGNLIYTRIEQLAQEPKADYSPVALLIQSLLESLLLLQSSVNDPFALFLQLLQRNLFPLPIEVVRSDQVLEV